MALRTAHGAGRKALVRAETAPVDELPEFVAEEAREERPTDRDKSGRFQPGNSLAGRGGAGKRGKARLAGALGLGELDQDPAFLPYRRLADAFKQRQCREISQGIGGGQCGIACSSMVASAALALAASRYLYDTANGDPVRIKTAADLADKSRQSLLTAFEIAARQAKARPKRKSTLAALLEGDTK